MINLFICMKHKKHQMNTMNLKQIGILFIILISKAYFLSAFQEPSKTFEKIQQIIDNTTSKKISGVIVHINSPEHGYWIGTSGYADLLTKKPINKKNVFSLASIGKTYTATAVLNLIENGKLQLDDPIKKYLPKEVIEGLVGAEKVTIRNLLGHTSGFYNYNRNPELNELYLSGNLKLDTLTHINTLRRYAYGKVYPDAIHGTYNYCSTNYLLLSMIMDKVTPKGHISYVEELLKKHGFNHTFYKKPPSNNELQYYGDINLDKNLENLTSQTIETTNWYSGDDGIYATIEDACNFLTQLIKGNILKEKTVKKMMTWNDDKNPDYGLGLMANKGLPYNFLVGHSGRGIGVTTDLYYFPNQDITVAIFSNTGLRSASPIFKKEYNKMRNKIVKAIFL